jgi:hypothetical protein
VALPVAAVVATVALALARESAGRLVPPDRVRERELRGVDVRVELMVMPFEKMVYAVPRSCEESREDACGA